MTSDPHKDETETLRRLIRNAERLTSEQSTPQHDAIERSFEHFRALTEPLSDTSGPQDGYETGAEDPEIEGWDPPRVRRGQRAALVGRNFFGVRGLLIGGASVDDLVIVSSRRLEFTVPDAATSSEAVMQYEPSDHARREPEMELTVPSIESPTAK